MGYYDRVKDSIREENSSEEEKNGSRSDSSNDSSAPSGNFDTLREAAENTEVEDEEEGDDTPIEVLEEDGLSEQAPGRQRKQRSREEETSERNRTRDGGRGSERTSELQESSGSEEISGDTSDIEDKLDRIIEQNARMIEILEGFGN